MPLVMAQASGNRASASGYFIRPALKVCVTTGLSKKEIEKAGVTIRHAITKVMTKKSNAKRLSGEGVTS